ncbi:MAG: hypothetical protein NZZ60_06875 [Bacteroidia bacterium]|nr:hypothetical protein [Bacteroidia bacterium]MCX7652896.1 hypothetical protein [Bacteroidia bacterium]MDW8416636.1 hypothetical protein [Bacteroidia bacterium]
MVRYLAKALQATGLVTAFTLGQVPHTKEGFLLPTRDTIYILVVFAEVDYTACGDDPHERQYGHAWGRDTEGETKCPPDADSLLDSHGVGRGLITRTYAEASFGQLVVLGDYIPEVVKVPCQKIPAGGTQSLYQEVDLVIQAFSSSHWRTAHNLSWERFDRWELLPQRAGLPKLRSRIADPGYRPRLDVLFIIWRNLAHRLDIRKPPFPCNYGFGLWICDISTPFGPFTGGIETASSYTTCGTAKTGVVGFLAEFFHGLYGGNHWHTAGGAGLHTFPFLPVCRGLSTQGSRPIYAIGYDRWLMDWRAPGKAYTLSALDEAHREVPTDLRQPPKPEILRIWLRDFMTTGDVVRIQLPYTEKGGPRVKHQYLWLENRRFIVSSEVWGVHVREPCVSVPPGALRGFPGLYAYIQVGKDKLTGEDIYSADPSHPNGLGSWIFWLPAEGRYDYEFRNSTRGWALDKSASLPNPFLGMHDFYLSYDVNGDGLIQPNGEGPGFGVLEWRGDSVCASWYSFGDEWDAFQPGDNLSLSTNPAPVPVYTLRSEEGYRGSSRSRPAPYDNRAIWLNGLRISILRERADGALLVEIRWNDFSVKGQVRWCGDIRVGPHPYDSLAPAFRIEGEVLLDRSLSPVYGQAIGYDSVEKRHWFSDTTQLVVERGARLYLARKARLILRRGSRLVISEGAQVYGEGKIEVESGGKVLCHSGGQCLVSIRERRRPYRLFLR